MAPRVTTAASSGEPAGPMQPRESVDRRSGGAADRRSTPRGGRRITDLATHPDGHITVQAFADYLGVHRKTVAKFIRAGLLTAYVFAGKRRIKTSDARAFVAAARFNPRTG